MTASNGWRVPRAVGKERRPLAARNLAIASCACSTRPRCEPGVFFRSRSMSLVRLPPSSSPTIGGGTQEPSRLSRMDQFARPWAMVSATGRFEGQDTTSGCGRSATFKSERERFDRRRSEFDPERPLSLLQSRPSTKEGPRRPRQVARKSRTTRNVLSLNTSRHVRRDGDAGHPRSPEVDHLAPIVGARPAGTGYAPQRH